MRAIRHKFYIKTRRVIISLFILFFVSIFSACGSEFEILLDQDALRETWIYWSEDSKVIKKIKPDGTGEALIRTAANMPLDVAVYTPGNRIYWTEYTAAPDYQINYANLDGTGGIMNLLTYTTAQYSGPFDIFIDSGAGVIYWSGYQIPPTKNRVLKSSLSSFLEVIVLDDISSTNFYKYTYSVSVNTVNGDIYTAANTYWDRGPVLGNDNKGTLSLGISAEPEVTGPAVDSVPLKDLAVDGIGGYVYYIINDAISQRIMRANLTFGGSSTWITAAGIDKQKLALDTVNKKIYWTAPTDRKIYRADMGQAESGVEVFLDLAPNAPTGIAISN